MPQMIPNYKYMTSIGSEYILTPLIERYGHANVIWPIVILKDSRIQFYLYEKNNTFLLNDKDDNRPLSGRGIINYFLDYSLKDRKITASDSILNKFIATEYNCSYDFILKNNEYSSVDIDYAWLTSDGWKAMELTTVWMPLSSKQEAERLVKTFNRRPSWKGKYGPHGIRKLIQATTDLGMNYYMVVVNSLEKVSNNLNINGNALWFPLTDANIDRIMNGDSPENSVFGTYKEFINWM